MSSPPESPELTPVEGGSKRETLLRIKACCNDELLVELGLNKPLNTLTKKKKSKDVEKLKARFLELANSETLMLFDILATRHMPSLESHEYPNRVVGGMVVSIQSTVRGHLARRRTGRLTGRRPSRSQSPVNFQPISPNTISPRLLPNIGQPVIGLSLAPLDELVMRFPRTTVDAEMRQQLEPVVVEEEFSQDHTYLLDCLEAKQRRLQTTLMNLASVYKKQVDVYNEYQHTYSAIVGHADSMQSLQ